ncbi:hypothetical protein HD806DRAFT_499079 [Xylariaceae sp. AK1471]|nr:hypothetical protein HD806DRAFT_499079 [Xylariaceae sp. AK1471]
MDARSLSQKSSGCIIQSLQELQLQNIAYETLKQQLCRLRQTPACFLPIFSDFGKKQPEYWLKTSKAFRLRAGSKSTYPSGYNDSDGSLCDTLPNTFVVEELIYPATCHPLHLQDNLPPSALTTLYGADGTQDSLAVRDPYHRQQLGATETSHTPSKKRDDSDISAIMCPDLYLGNVFQHYQHSASGDITQAGPSQETSRFVFQLGRLVIRQKQESGDYEDMDTAFGVFVDIACPRKAVWLIYDYCPITEGGYRLEKPRTIDLADFYTPDYSQFIFPHMGQPCNDEDEDENKSQDEEAGGEEAALFDMVQIFSDISDWGTATSEQVLGTMVRTAVQRRPLLWGTTWKMAAEAIKDGWKSSKASEAHVKRCSLQ